MDDYEQDSGELYVPGPPEDINGYLEAVEREEEERRRNEELSLDSLRRDNARRWLEERDREQARNAAQERVGRGAKGMSERSRREMWSKEFQLAEGRPHLHLLMKGPDAMSEEDYRGFQLLTRLGRQNERRYGKQRGR